MAGAEKRRQFTNTALYLAPIVIGNFVPILTLPIFTRLISTDDYGAWALANVYAIFVSGIVSFGLPTAYERNFFQHTARREAAQLLYSVMAFVACGWFAFAVATWIFGEPLARWVVGSSRYRWLLFWSLVTTATASVKNFYLAYLRNSEEASPYVRYMIGERLGGAALQLVLVAGFGMGALGLVLGQLAGVFVIFVLVAVRFLRTLPPAFDRRLLSEALRLGLPLTPRIFLGVLSKNFDKYLIGQIASLGGVGIFSVGQRIAYVAFTYSTALDNVSTPQVYRRMFALGERGGAEVGRYLTPFAYATAVVAFGIAIFSEEILWVLTPASYHAAAPVVAILALYYAVQFFGKLPQLTYAKQMYLISVLSTVTLALNVGLGALCIWQWGVMGAALGTLAAGVISIGLVLAAGQRYYPIKWEVRRLVGIYGLLFASVLLTLLLGFWNVDYTIRLAAKLGLFGLFVALGIRLRYITRENFRTVRDVVMRRPEPRDPMEAGATA